MLLAATAAQLAAAAGRAPFAGSALPRPPAPQLRESGMAARGGAGSAERRIRQADTNFSVNFDNALLSAWAALTPPGRSAISEHDCPECAELDGRPRD